MCYLFLDILASPVKREESSPPPPVAETETSVIAHPILGTAVAGGAVVLLAAALGVMAWRQRQAQMIINDELPLWDNEFVPGEIDRDRERTVVHMESDYK